MKLDTLKTAASLLALGMALLAAPVMAQAAEDNSDDTEIFVTAQRRAEKAVDVPISVVAIDAGQLDTANARTLSDISKMTPALRFDNAFAFSQPTIRGVGTAVVTSGGQGNVGIYVDGFYSPNPLATDFELMNLTGVQVLKGPQGTLFGRNTTGGAILVQTADPSKDLSGKLRFSYGRFNQARAQAYITGGLTDTIAFDLEGSYRRGDGWIRNIATASKKDGRFRNWSIRTGLKVDFSPSVSLLLRYMHGDIDDPTSLLTNTYVDPVLGATAANFAPPTSYTTVPGLFAPGANKRIFQSKNNVYQGTLKADIGFADLTSYSQYRTEKTEASNDLDQIGLTIFQIGLPIKDSTLSQEFLFTSKPGGALQWTAGLFYFQTRDTYRTFVDNTNFTTARIPIGGSSTLTKSYAAFIDLTYEVSPDFFLTVGGRYSHDQIDDAYYIPAFTGVKTFVTQAQSDAVKKGRFTPRIVLRYKPSDQSSVYASFAKGYKAGLLDVGGSTGNPVNPETLNAFELGYKFDNRTLSFDAAGYYYDYKNLQVSLFQGNPPSAQLVNAASSRIYGLEGQLRYTVSDAFQLNAGLGWTHARYRRFDNAPIYARCPGVGGCGGGTSFFVQTGTTLRNVTMQRTPGFTGNLGAQYKTDLASGKLTLSTNLYYTSKFNFGPSGIQFPQKGYEQVSARAQWSDADDRFFVALWGDNLTNKRFVTQVQYNNFGIGSGWNQPISYGLEVGAKF